jgi:hypothetical protein
MTAPDAATRATWGHRSGPYAQIRRWQPCRIQAGTQLTFLDIELPSGMIINGCKLMIGPNGKRWIAMPAERQVDRDSHPRLDVNGKQLWSPIVQFVNREAADRVCNLILDALQRQHSGAIDGNAA